MKIIIALLFPLVAVSQDTSIHNAFTIYPKTGGTFIYSMQVVFMSDSTIEIYPGNNQTTVVLTGDTAKALWKMYEYATAVNNNYWAARNVLDCIKLQGLKDLFHNKDFSRIVDYYIKQRNDFDKKFKLK